MTGALHLDARRDSLRVWGDDIIPDGEGVALSYAAMTRLLGALHAPDQPRALRACLSHAQDDAALAALRSPGVAAVLYRGPHAGNRDAVTFRDHAGQVHTLGCAVFDSAARPAHDFLSDEDIAAFAARLEADADLLISTRCVEDAEAGSDRLHAARRLRGLL